MHSAPSSPNLPPAEGGEGFRVGSETLQRAARSVLALLDDRTRRIIDARYGLSSGSPLTLQAVGDREDITRERVRQLTQGVLKNLQQGSLRLPSEAEATRGKVGAVLQYLGGVALEETLLWYLGGTVEGDRAGLRFILSSLPGVTPARETQRTNAHWTHIRSPLPRSEGEPPALEIVLEAAETVLGKSRRLLSDNEFLSALRGELPAPLSEAALRSFLSVGKRVIRTSFGEWGLRAWPEAAPRSVGDKAYVVLKRSGHPLHFRAIAEAINAAGFDAKRAHPQTVHNELIRDQKFVLVGRGLYGLREWGLRPGTVVEVLVRVLKSKGRSLSKRELVAEVLKERVVRRNTVLISLHNQGLFQKLPDGTYALAEQGTAPAPESLGPSGAAPSAPQVEDDEAAPRPKDTRSPWSPTGKPAAPP